MSMYHSFDIEIAEKYGVNQSIMLCNLYFWVKRNKANDKNCFNGKYWTYNSKKAFTEIFPYWSEKQIRDIIKRLKDEGLIETGCFNENKFDRTGWYTLTDKGFSFFESIDQKENIDLTKKSNDIRPKSQMISNLNNIYNNITDINTNINTHTKECVPKNLKKLNVLSIRNGVYEIDFKKNFDLMIEDYPKSAGITASKKIIANYLTNGIPNIEGVTFSMISLSVRTYILEWKKSGRDKRYIKDLDNYLKSDDFIDNIIATRETYENGMLLNYGADWRNARFKYKGIDER